MVNFEKLLEQLLEKPLTLKLLTHIKPAPISDQQRFYKAIKNQDLKLLEAEFSNANSPYGSPKLSDDMRKEIEGYQTTNKTILDDLFRKYSFSTCSRISTRGRIIDRNRLYVANKSIAQGALGVYSLANIALGIYEGIRLLKYPLHRRISILNLASLILNPLIKPAIHVSCFAVKAYPTALFATAGLSALAYLSFKYGYQNAKHWWNYKKDIEAEYEKAKDIDQLFAHRLKA